MNRTTALFLVAWVTLGDATPDEAIAVRDTGTPVEAAEAREFEVRE